MYINKLKKLSWRVYVPQKNNLQNSQCPLIVIAQSLGCQVISNYIWDSQKEDKDETIWDENSSDYINPHDDEIDFFEVENNEIFIHFRM